MIKFDNISFNDEGELWGFLKHQYFAYKSRISILQKDLSKMELRLKKLENEGKVGE